MVMFLNNDDIFFFNDNTQIITKKKMPAASGVSPLETPNELRTFLASHSFAVVDFYATWCGPCMAIKGAYAALAKKYPSIGLAQVNVEEGGELAEKYRVDSLPTFICFAKGEKVRCIKGADIATVEATIKSHVAKAGAAVQQPTTEKKQRLDAKSEARVAPKKVRDEKVAKKKNAKTQ
ncbi:thioredoxin, putative [Bodo saltans]|uniref:Thioredoxin, putative n=1 Tax=Bodo saltans TaxID=75058 RepID=A0A0S4JC51_BODSA|nr:thioredoxin, putative [Bodo saltans]|eukprot:CUG87717.1 thioredoxin, putative [Bodo saltans]